MGHLTDRRPGEPVVRRNEDVDWASCAGPNVPCGLPAKLICIMATRVLAKNRMTCKRKTKQVLTGAPFLLPLYPPRYTPPRILAPGIWLRATFGDGATYPHIDSGRPPLCVVFVPRRVGALATWWSVSPGRSFVSKGLWFTGASLGELGNALRRSPQFGQRSCASCNATWRANGDTLSGPPHGSPAFRATSHPSTSIDDVHIQIWISAKSTTSRPPNVEQESTPPG